MKKYLLLISLIASTNAPLFSQDSMEVVLHNKMDSLKKIVEGKTGKEKVDDLNRIVDLYQKLDEDDQMQVDSATPYARQAISEAKKIDYKRGLGYANLKMSYCEWKRNGIYLQKNKKNDHGIIMSLEDMIKQSIQIGEELGDNIMIGSAYSLSGWVEKQKGNTEQAVSFQKKAIASIEKTLDKKQPEGYKEMEFTFCAACKSIEVRIAWLYMEMIFLQKRGKDNEQYLNLAISYYEKAGANSDVIGETYMRYARWVGVNTNAETAVEYFKKAIPHFQLSGNKQQELNATTMVSASYWVVGDLEKGFEYSKKSVRLAEKLAKENSANLSKDELGRAYYWMGRFYSVAGDYETALKVTKRGQDYFSDNPGWKNNWSSLMGDIYRSMKKYDSAMYYLASFEKASEPSNGKLYLSILYTDLKQYEKALPLINFVLEKQKLTGNLGNLGHDYTERAAIWLGKKNYTEALKDARIGFALLTQAKRYSGLVNTSLILSDIFTKMGKYDSAYYYLKQNTILKDSFLNRQFYIRLNDYKKEAEEEKKISHINLLNKDNQLKEQKLKQESSLKKFLLVSLVLLLVAGVFILRYFTAKRNNEKLQREQAEQEWKLKHLESEKKQAELHHRAAELEMQALRAQMNPHFIFNCLSSINRIIMKNDSQAASDYLTRFSRLMRMVLINSQRSMIPLEDELQMLRLYLDMERLRFKDSFDYSIIFTNTIDEGAVFIPPLLLQPFCENAIWHGLMQKDGPGQLNIELSMSIRTPLEDNKVLQCTISDDGIGREAAEKLKSKSAGTQKSMGLQITAQRLALLNQDKGVHTLYEIEDMKDENGNALGTRVVLKIFYKESTQDTFDQNNITAVNMSKKS